MGTWNATTHAPDITTLGSFNPGDYYIVDTPGSYTSSVLTSNTTNFSVGNWVMFNGSTWDKILNGNLSGLGTTNYVPFYSSSSVLANSPIAVLGTNVGIGTITPGSKLDVKGTIRLSGSTSGYVGLAPAAVAGGTTYTLPSADGTSGQVLTTSGTGVLSWTSASVSGGTMTEVSSANTDIGVANGTSAPVLTLNSGTGANQIVKLTAASKLPAVDGSLLTNLTSTNLVGAIAIANGGTGATTLGASQSALGITIAGPLTGNVPSLGTGIIADRLCASDLSGTTISCTNNLPATTVKNSVLETSGTGDLLFANSPTITNPVITSIVPASDFTIVQNGVAPFRSVNSGAVANTLYLSGGKVGVGTSSPVSPLHISKTDTTTSGTNYVVQIKPTYNQASGSSANTDLLINREEISVGSGTQYLIDGQVGGVSKFSVNTAGVALSTGLRINGATSGVFGIKSDVSTVLAGSTTGRIFDISAGTINRVNDSGTIAHAVSASIQTPVFTSGSATTYTNASTFFVGGAPTAGTNAILTNRWAAYLNGNTYIGGNLSIGAISPTSKMTVKAASNNVNDYPIHIHNLADTMRTGHGTYGMSNKVGTAQNIDYTYDVGGAQIFNTGGAERLRILSTGEVGIGTPSPSTKFETQVPNASGAATVAGTFSMASFTGTVNNEVKVLLGPTNLPGDSAGISASRRVGGSTGFSIYTGNAGAALEAVHIKGNGNVGIGITGPNHRLDVAGDINTSTVLRIAGTSVCSSAGCTSSSDRTLKENINPITNAFDNILKLQGVGYDWKDKKKYGGKPQIGLIAQDVEKIYPEVVITDEKTGLKSMAYDHLISPLIEAFKELNKRFTGLKGEFNVMLARVMNIEKMIASNEIEIDAKTAKLQSENAALKRQFEAETLALRKENQLIKAKLEKIEKLLEK